MKSKCYILFILLFVFLQSFKNEVNSPKYSYTYYIVLDKKPQRLSGSDTVYLSRKDIKPQSELYVELEGCEGPEYLKYISANFNHDTIIFKCGPIEKAKFPVEDYYSKGLFKPGNILTIYESSYPEHKGHELGIIKFTE